VRSVIDLLAAPGVVDELGVGIVRDAFADTMFPGVSTIQTRPKYFLIVPRILKDYENLPDRKRKQQSALEYLAEQEMYCRIALGRRYEFRQGLGIIGVSFQERTDRDVLRQPSSVYWNGLSLFNIIRPDISMDDFDKRYSGHRPPSSLLLQETKNEHGDDFDADDLNASPIIRLPEVEEWKEDLAITLTAEDARFLRNQIGATQAHTLLGQILLDSELLEQVALLPSNALFSDLLKLPGIKTLKDRRMLRIIQLAADFWHLLSGAHLRYNILLQNRYGNEEKEQEYLVEWAAWMDELRSFDWEAFSMEEIWSLVEKRGRKPHAWTRKFIEQWIDAIRQPAGDKVLNEIVVRQESANKRTRARLRTDSKDVSATVWIGFQDLAYRLPQVRQMALDIHRAEIGEADPDAGL
jgi:hypothetical protein